MSEAISAIPASSAKTTPLEVIGNWIDGRFMALFNGNHCAALIFNQMIRCQIHFDAPFFHSSQQFQKDLLIRFSKDAITQAIRLILKVVPGVQRWLAAAGRRLRVSHYFLDLEQIRGFLAAQGFETYLDKSDANYPFTPNAGVGSGVKPYAKNKPAREEEVPVVPVPSVPDTFCIA